MRKCPTCRDSFGTRKGLAVHHSSVQQERLPNRKCKNCYESFHSPYQKKYCSEKCKDQAGSFVGEKNPNYQGGREKTQCELCGNSFSYYPSAKEGLYCPKCVASKHWQHQPDNSRENNPRWNGGKREYECAICEKTIERYPSNATGEVTVCSQECRATWLSDVYTGEGHPNWKGGGNEPYGKGWAAVRTAALERDEYECVICGTSREELGRNPDVHHIIPVRHFIESEDKHKADAHVIDNVVTLCTLCHRRADFGHIAPDQLRQAGGIAAPSRSQRQA